MRSRLVALLTVLMLFAVISAVVIYGEFLVARWGDWPDAASFGESFGALSCLISALGFIGVIFALSMQYVQIRDSQRQSQTTGHLQLLVAYLLCDAVAPADKASVARVLEAAVARITPSLLEALKGEE